MKIAIVDIGSNTIRMNIYFVTDTSIRRIVSEKETAGLVGYIAKDGAMSQDGVQAVVHALDEFKLTADAVECDEFHAFATASLRNITNTDEVVDQIQRATGIMPTVLTGAQEASLDYSALHDEIGSKSGLMVDLGGGSVELVHFCDGQIANSSTLSFGSLALYKQFVSGIFPSKEELKNISKYVQGRLKEAPWLPGLGKDAFLIGGTARAMGKIHMRLKRVSGEISGYSMDFESVKALRSYLLEDQEKRFPLLIKTCPDRVHTILPGIAALHAILKTAQSSRATIYNVGIREGFLKQFVLNRGDSTL